MDHARQVSSHSYTPVLWTSAMHVFHNWLGFHHLFSSGALSSAARSCCAGSSRLALRRWSWPWTPRRQLPWCVTGSLNVGMVGLTIANMLRLVDSWQLIENLTTKTPSPSAGAGSVPAAADGEQHREAPGRPGPGGRVRHPQHDPRAVGRPEGQAGARSRHMAGAGSQQTLT